MTEWNVKVFETVGESHCFITKILLPAVPMPGDTISYGSKSYTVIHREWELDGQEPSVILDVVVKQR